MPLLSVEALRKQIKSGTFAPVYVIVGEDTRLVDGLVDGIEATIDPADRAFSVDRVYATEGGGSPVDIVAAARTPSMIGGPRVVIVLRAERLFKPKRAAKKTETEESESDAADVGDASNAPRGDSALDLAPIDDYLASPLDTTTLVFVAADVDLTRRTSKKLKELAQFVECHGLETKSAENRREATNTVRSTIQNEMMQMGRTLEPAGLQLLIDRTGLDITQLRGAIERLLLYAGDTKTITVDDVREVVGEHAFVDDWAVINAIGDGDAARALRALAQRFERGDSPHGIVGQLRWWVSSRLAEAEPDRVRPALEALLRTDLALKSSGGDDRVLLERLVVDLTGKALARSGWR